MSTTDKHAPPFAFAFLHLCTAWPVGVVSLALASGLVKAGVSVGQTAGVVAAATLAFTLEFLWAPLVDASLTRKAWFVLGATIMFAGLFAMLLVPWNARVVPLLTALAFLSCSGSAIAAASVKGIMAYDVKPSRLSTASGYYSAGGILAKIGGGAGTLYLITHLASRPLAAAISIAAGALAGSAILLASPETRVAAGALLAKLGAALLDLWNFVRKRDGVLIALLCVIPFGAGTEAGLMGAIAREWHVSADALALLATIGVGTNLAAALAAGLVASRIGPWPTYFILGWAMILVMILFAFAPRTLPTFFAGELAYRALSSGCYVALLSLVMTSIGKGAATTKAACFWSLVNLAYVYPTLIEGAVHDRVGTTAMLLSDAALGTAGFAVIMIAIRLLKPQIASDPTPVAA